MNTPILISDANRQATWEPTVLNFAVMELMREFPKLDAAVIVQAVNLAAQQVKPALGRVALHQKARERLRK